jgi:hypothetical protein
MHTAVSGTDRSAFASILIHRFAAGTTPFGPSEKFGSALWAVIPFQLLLNPLLRPEFPPHWNSSQDNLLAHSQREVLYEITGKIPALVASLVALLFCTRSDGAYLAVFEAILRHAALTDDFIRGNSVHGAQSFFELSVVVPVCDKDTANPAIEAAWGKQVFVCHLSFPFLHESGAIMSVLECCLPTGTILSVRCTDALILKKTDTSPAHLTMTIRATTPDETNPENTTSQPRGRGRQGNDFDYGSACEDSDRAVPLSTVRGAIAGLDDKFPRGGTEPSYCPLYLRNIVNFLRGLRFDSVSDLLVRVCSPPIVGLSSRRYYRP